jgi:hypothetical protein
MTLTVRLPSELEAEGCPPRARPRTRWRPTLLAERLPAAPASDRVEAFIGSAAFRATPAGPTVTATSCAPRPLPAAAGRRLASFFYFSPLVHREFAVCAISSAAMSVMRLVLGSLRDAKVRWLVLLGMLGLIAGAGLLTAAAAQAVTGSGPGQLALHPPSGATSLEPTWSTTTACPAGFQATAVLYALNADGSVGTAASPSVAYVTSAFSGSLLGAIGKIISLGTNVTAGGTSEFVVACSTGLGGTGNRTYVQAEWVTLSANGSTYTTSSTPPASPNPASTQPTPAGASASSPTPVSTGTPSGAAATGGGEASLSGSGNNVRLGLGAAALAGSAAAMGLAIRRARRNW